MVITLVDAVVTRRSWDPGRPGFTLPTGAYGSG